MSIGRHCFVRFGDPPDSGRSINSRTRCYELGVSVWEALERSGRYHIILPGFDGSALDTLSDCYNAAQTLYGLKHWPIVEVAGFPAGTGSDGEPVLRGCHIVRRLSA